MKLIWSPDAWSDYVDWQRTDASVVPKINDLIKATSRTPFARIGRPEPLKGVLAGWWSRRITGEHRFVYRMSGSQGSQALEIAQ